MEHHYSAEELLQAAYQYLPAVMFAKDIDGRYVFSSTEDPLVDGGVEESILGKTDLEIQFDPELGKKYFAQDQQIVSTGQPVRCISEFRKGEKRIYREVAKHAIRDDSGQIVGVGGIISDVTELEELRKKFRQLTLFDSLTGVYNRNYVMEYDFDSEDYLPCGYIVCDCNDLKKINDTMGHEEGDHFIKAMAEVMSNVVEDNGIVVRWGGDEFLAIIPNCDEAGCTQMVKRMRAEQQKLRQSLPYASGALGWMIRSSLTEEESQIIELADHWMYADKRRSKEKSAAPRGHSAAVGPEQVGESHIAFMERAFQSLHATVFIKDTQCRYVFTTQVYKTLKGDETGSILGLTDLEVQRDRKLGEKYFREDLEILATGKPCRGVDACQVDGETWYVEAKRSAIFNEEGEVIGVCGVVTDVTELISYRKKFEQLSLYDSLTFAYSRHYTAKYDFEDPSVLPCSYIMCDCNDLKQVNDDMGHVKGDQYICRAAEAIRKAITDRSVLIRWGGDEFLVITPNSSEEELEAMLQGINEQQEKLRDEFPYFGIAVGGAVRFSLDTPESEIIRTVDRRMYVDKMKKKGTL